MIGFLKMVFCVQVLLKNYYCYYFGQSLDYSHFVTIFPFHVRTYENCEMFKANYWNPLEGEERGAPSPSETYSSAFGLLTFSATENLLEDILACSVCGREVIFKVHVKFSIAEMILWECLWKLSSIFAFPNYIYHYCFSQYLYYCRWIIWDTFLQRELVIHTSCSVLQSRGVKL